MAKYYIASCVFTAKFPKLSFSDPKVCSGSIRTDGYSMLCPQIQAEEVYRADAGGILKRILEQPS